MRYDKYIFLFLILCLGVVDSSKAFAQCANVRTPKVRLELSYGEVFYDNSKSNTQFPSMPYASTMGLTYSQLVQNISVETYGSQKANGSACLGLDKLTIEIGYPKIDVFIDKKYRPGSCNYNVIKEHENYHVRVQQEGLKAFSQKLKEAYTIAAKNVKPVLIRSNAEGQQAVEKMVSQIKRDVQPLLNYLEQRLREENLVIDTQTSYAAESKKCRKW